MGWYSGGGYVAELGHNLQEARAVIGELIEHRWLDDYNRVVFIEFLMYNPNINLFGICLSIVEWAETGGKYSLK